MKRIFWINIHYACFGIISVDDVVKETPPIAHWMKGKTLKEIKPFLLDKKAVVVEITKNDVAD